MTSNIDIITDQLTETLHICRRMGLMNKLQCSILIEDTFDKINAVVDERPATEEEICWNMGGVK